MKLRRFRAWLQKLWCTRVHPSPLQREFRRGDPHGTVRDYASLVIAELETEMRISHEKKEGT